MNTPTKPTTSLSLADGGGRQLLEASLAEYVAFMRRQPAFCGTPEQQQTLSSHVARGQELIKLVAGERLKITRELDHQKQEWMALEKQLTEPVMAAMQPLKDAVEHYNREIMRVREHQLAEGAPHEPGDGPDWLTAQVEVVDKPRGVRTKWAFRVVDPSQVPNGYWQINEGAIKADIAKGVHSIAGVDIYEEVVTIFRAL